VIRALKAFEVGICVDPGEKWFVESNLPGRFDRDLFYKNWRGVIESDTGVILVPFTDDGVPMGALGGLLLYAPFTGDPMAMVSFWYMFEGYRGYAVRLLNAFEEWGRSRQVVRVVSCHLELESTQPNKLRRLHKLRGYQPLETMYFKML
jgi:hypothetical protein